MIPNKSGQQVAVYGSLTIDIFANLPASSQKDEKLLLDIGDKIRLEQGAIFPGGGAFNVAAGLSKLGHQAAVAGALGDRVPGEFIRSELDKLQIDHRQVVTVPEHLSSFSVVLTAGTGDRTVLHQRTTSPDFSRKIVSKMTNSEAVFTGHLYPESAGILDELVTQAPQNWGWNPGKTQLQEPFANFSHVFPHISLLILNKEEAEIFSGKTASLALDLDTKTIGALARPTQEEGDLFDFRHIADQFLEAGIKNLIITDGKRGAQAWSNSEHWRVGGGIIKKRASTLGAGDATSAGAFGALLLNKDIATMLDWGTRNAESVITQWGAHHGQLEREELEK